MAKRKVTKTELYDIAYKSMTMAKDGAEEMVNLMIVKDCIGAILRDVTEESKERILDEYQMTLEQVAE